MTLIWHDWFATSNETVNSQRHDDRPEPHPAALCLSSFPRMLKAMTIDPAMLMWLSGAGSTKEAPNENYAREMQELFTLGVDNGYTEHDVREHARALTGWTNTWNSATGQAEDFRFEPKLHDDGDQGHLRPAWTLRLDGQHRPRAGPPRATRATSSRGCGPTSAPSRCRRHTSAPPNISISPAASRSGRSSRRC